MNYPKIRFYFDRKKKSSADRQGIIEVEVYFGGKRKYFSTGIGVLPSEWNGSEITNRSDAYGLNMRIRNRMTPINEAIQQMTAAGEEFTFGALESRLRRKDPRGSFVDYAAEKIRDRNDIRESTRKAHAKLIPALKEFGRIHSFSDLTRTNVAAFDNWLHGRYENQRTIYSYHKFLKKYINCAIIDGYVGANPYLGMKLKRGEEAPRRFLSDEQIAAVAAVDVDDRSVMNARDVFLFQCYTGMAYSDVSLFNFEKMEKKGDRYVINARRLKTGMPYYLVLLSPAVEILKRHKFRLPIVTNQKYNQALKAVAAHAGIRMNLTSHCGRHTFATWALNQGVSLDTVKEMLGHSDTKTTRIYAKLLHGTVEDAFEALEAKISKN